MLAEDIYMHLQEKEEFFFCGHRFNIKGDLLNWILQI